MRICLAHGCENIVRSKSYCFKHYARFKRRGSPYIVLTNYDKKPKYASLKEYIDQSYKLDFETNCWEWTRSLKNFGYGNAWWERKHWIAHRLSWVFYNGEISKDTNVLHKCDNAKCINPEHLFLGSYLDNNIDRKNKGRNANTNGDKNPFSKLKEHQVIDIIQRLENGEKGRRLAELYSVSKGAISKIKKGKNWSYLRNK